MSYNQDLLISYCGWLTQDIPKKAKDGHYILLHNGTLFKWTDDGWVRQRTPDIFYFFELKKRKLLKVDPKNKSIKSAKLHDRVLDCSGRKICDVIEDEWFEVCDLTDTKSIVRMTVVGDEDEAVLKLEDKDVKILKKSQICKKDVKICKDRILIDLHGWKDRESRVLIYQIKPKKSEGKVWVVNHIILKLISDTSCGELKAANNIKKGDLVRLVYDGEECPAKVRTVQPTGTYEWVSTASHVTTTNNNNNNGPNNVRPQSIVTDCLGNSYVTGPFIGTITFANDGEEVATITSINGADVFVAKLDIFGDWVWVAQARAEGVARSFDIAIDCNNDIYITGFFSNPLTFINANGSPAFTQALIGSGQDIFVAKINSDGVWQWSNAAGGSNDDRGHGISTDCQNAVYITGFIQDQATFPGAETPNGNGNVMGDGDVVIVAKLNATTGQWIWVAKADEMNEPTNEDDQGIGIDTDCNGNSYVTGIYKSDLRFTDADSDVNIPDLPSASNDSAFIARIDYDGNWQWARRVAPPSGGIVRAFDVATDLKGGVFMVGTYTPATVGAVAHFYSPIDNNNAEHIEITIENVPNDLTGFFVAKLSAGGQWLWASKADGNFSENGNLEEVAPERTFPHIATDCSGNAYVAGTFEGTVRFGDNITLSVPTNPQSADPDEVFIAKIDGEGNWIWARQGGGANDDKGIGISTDCQGCVYATGWFEGTATFGDIQVSGPPSTNGIPANAFVTKLSQDPQERMLGVAQEWACEGYPVAVKWRSRFLDDSHCDLLPGFDYFLNAEGEIEPICKCSYCKYPIAQYIGTACSPRDLLIA